MLNTQTTVLDNIPLRVQSMGTGHLLGQHTAPACGVYPLNTANGILITGRPLYVKLKAFIYLWFLNASRTAPHQPRTGMS